MEKRVETSGHWIGILAQREDDQIHYYITDSRNQKDPSWANQLSKILSEETIAKIQFSEDFDHLLDSIQNRLFHPELRGTEEEKIGGALESLQKFEKKVVDHDLSNDRAWREVYHDRISKLVTATIEKASTLEASSLKDKTILEKLHELK